VRSTTCIGILAPERPSWTINYECCHYKNRSVGVHAPFCRPVDPRLPRYRGCSDSGDAGVVARRLPSESRVGFASSFQYCYQALTTQSGILSVIAIVHQSSGVRSTTTAASCSLFALPHSFRAAAVTDEQLVYGRSALLTRVFAPASSRRFLDAFTA
jgi:hypothetical protein